MHDREARRLSFGPVAREYLAARPGYPSSLIDDLLAAADLGPNDEVLEIGTGPGVATRTFAERGLRVLGVDIGPELITVAREHLAGFPQVRFEVRDFNAWTPPSNAFQLITSAQAWQWVDDDSGSAKVCASLKPGGLFAPFWNFSVGPAPALQEAYAEHAPELVATAPYPRIDERIERRRRALADTDRFESIEVRRYPWPMRLDADAYVALLATFSDHIVMAPERQASLFDAIREQVHSDGGVITRDMEGLLFLCRPR